MRHKVVAALALCLALATSAPAEDSPSLAGHWFGEIVPAEGGLLQWIDHRRADQTYRVRFQHYVDCKLVRSQVESGVWRYTPGELKEITTMVAGRPANFRDTYRVTKFDGKRMEYTHTTTGIAYVAERVDDGFKFPGCRTGKR
jgi:hypothetical protein